MKLSTKGRYGARAMLDLALHYGNSPVLLRDIAKRQEISEGYLENLMSSLRTSGLVNSIRGARGGYILAKPPSAIRLSEVLRALEGSMAPAECVDDPKLCHRVNFCVTRDIWTEMKDAITRVLDSITLEEMVQRQGEKERPAAIAYSI